MKCLALVIVALSMPVYSVVGCRNDIRPTMHRIWRFCLALLPGRVVSTLLQFFTPVLVSMLTGPVGTGLYDVLQRIPRFTKSVNRNGQQRAGPGRSSIVAQGRP